MGQFSMKLNRIISIQEIEIIFSMPALTLTYYIILRNLCAQLSFQILDMGDNAKFLGVLEQVMPLVTWKSFEKLEVLGKCRAI